MMLGIGLFLFTFGCLAATAPESDLETSMVNESGAMKKDGDAMMDTDGEAMSKTENGSMGIIDDASVSPFLQYVPFTQSAYAQAKADGKTIFLEFYANWCPICRAQAPALESGLVKIQSDNLVAFRVNYNDSDTDADESALAKKFNIIYQHTHLVVDAQEIVLLRSQESWSEEDVVEKIGAFA